MEDDKDSINYAIDSFNVKYFKEYAHNFHKWEEVSKGEKNLRMQILLVRGLSLDHSTK